MESSKQEYLLPSELFKGNYNSMVLQGYWRSHWCLLKTSTQKYFWSSWFCFSWGDVFEVFCLFVFSSLLTWKGFPSFNYFQIFIYKALSYSECIVCNAFLIMIPVSALSWQMSVYKRESIPRKHGSSLSLLL